jgi:hypothetical protein
MIVKTFFGTHLDLSKVIQISDARVFHNRQAGGVGFTIDVQLRDAPIEYSEDAPSDSYMHATPESVAALQVKVDELVKQWKTFKRQFDE